MSQHLLRLDIASKNDAGATVMHRFATESYVTSAGSTPASTYIEGRLSQPGLLPRSMHGANMLRGGIALSSGAIVLDNRDGELDSLMDYAYDGQEWVLYTVNRATGANEWPLRRGFIEQPLINEGTITFAVRDAAHALDIPLLRNRYGGTNALPAGLDGTSSDIGGQPKPLWLGHNRNVSPPCINTARLIYQVDGQRGLLTGWSMTAYDARAVITAGADYTSQSDMETNAPTVGQVRWWPAGGMCRLGAEPVGRFTVEGINPAHSGFGATAVSAVLRGLLDAAGLSRSIAIHFDADPDAGIYVQSDRTLLDAMGEVLASISGYLTFGWEPEGSYADLLWASQLCPPDDPPYSFAASLVMDTSSIKTGSLQQVAPGDAHRGLPVWRVNLQYARNYTPMSESDLAGVAMATRADLAQAYRTVTVSDSAIKTKWPYATELNVTTLLRNEAEAIAEATRLLNLHKVGRRLYQIAPPAEFVRMNFYPATNVPIGRLDIGALFYAQYPRMGFEAGKLCLITGMDIDLRADEYRLTVWG